MSLSLGDRAVGSGAPALLVAEIGSNHDGDLARALALIDAAAVAGAGAVQLHSFRAARLAAAHALRATDYHAAADAHAHLARAELRTEWHARLREHAAARHLVFLSTPFDAERATLLAALGVQAFPVAARDLGCPSLLRVLGGFGRPILLGVAGATRDEIDTAMAAVGEGAGAPARRPPFVLVTGPRADDRADLRAIARLEASYDCLVGWTDRRPGHVLALGAVARGACIVVKPFTDDRTRRGPDHEAALDPPAFTAMATAVRELESALGTDLRTLRRGIRRAPLRAARATADDAGDARAPRRGQKTP